MASFLAHLSPNEETTLRRIATSALAPGDIRVADAKRLIMLDLIKEEDGLLIPTSRGLERLQLDNPSPSAIGSAMAENTRRYSIQIVDLETSRDLIFTAVEWTDEEKRVAVEQVLRLAGIPEGQSQHFLDVVAPTPSQERDKE